MLADSAHKRSRAPTKANVPMPARDRMFEYMYARASSRLPIDKSRMILEEVIAEELEIAPVFFFIRRFRVPLFLSKPEYGQV